jgi:dinuclear metal center YbgI/SA1388 family protein
VARRDAILQYAAELLDLDAYPDYGPMGLQVEGADEVEKIACGVSASLALFQRAAELDAQLLIVHHGLFWDKDDRRIDGPMRPRLEALFDADLTLAAYHLALDAHPELGNNALVAKQLGIEPKERFAEIGFGGPLRPPTEAQRFARRVSEKLGREPLVFPHGPDTVKRAAVITGRGGKYFADAAAAGYDLFLTGEAEEPALHLARELGVHYVAAGHYATERLGVQALAKKLAEHFRITADYIELGNPV